MVLWWRCSNRRRMLAHPSRKTSMTRIGAFHADAEGKALKL